MGHNSNSLSLAGVLFSVFALSLSAAAEAGETPGLNGVFIGASGPSLATYVVSESEIRAGELWLKGPEGVPRSLAVVPGKPRFFLNFKVDSGESLLRGYTMTPEGTLKLTSELQVNGSWGPIVISPDGRRLVLIDRGGGMQAFSILDHGLSKADLFKPPRWHSDRFWVVQRPDDREFLLVHILRMVMSEFHRAEKLRWGKGLYPHTVSGTEVNGEDSNLYDQKSLDKVLLLQDGSLLLTTNGRTEVCVFGRKKPKFFPVSGIQHYGLAKALPDGTALAWSPGGGLCRWAPGKPMLLQSTDLGIPWSNGSVTTRFIWDLWHDKELNQTLLLTNSGLELIDNPLGAFTMRAFLPFEKRSYFTASAFIRTADIKKKGSDSERNQNPSAS